jgi:hypothetical protein
LWPGLPASNTAGLNFCRAIPAPPAGFSLAGHFFNDFLQSIMVVSLLVILTSLPLSVYTAYAHDAAQ